MRRCVLLNILISDEYVESFKLDQRTPIKTGLCSQTILKMFSNANQRPVKIKHVSNGSIVGWGHAIQNYPALQKLNHLFLLYTYCDEKYHSLP